MKIIYIADDGTQFDDEYKCKDYEWSLNHLHLKDIHAFDKDGNKLEDMLSDYTYNNAEKIIVTSNEALKDLYALVDYSGYCCYESINKVGEWAFDIHKQAFVMIKE